MFMCRYYSIFIHDNNVSNDHLEECGVSHVFQDLNLPPPPEDPHTTEIDECRLWIGNLDQRITE